MEHLLFLAQRIPYPPEKGEKIRAWHILRHLASRFHVHLGCFYDDPADAQHIPFLNEICTDICCPRLMPTNAKLRGIIGGFARGEALSLGYFADAALQRWVDSTLQAHRTAHVFVFSSAMATYVRRYHGGIRILDMVDVDSDKWRQYAPTKPWPLSAVYAREHRTLLAFERAMAQEFDATLLVSPAEVDLFRALAPEAASRIHCMANGIDTEFYDPDQTYPNPFPRPVPNIVFTGAMDYWPNVQAVIWFVADIMPLLRQTRPDLEFFIVGLNPVPSVRRLADQPGVTVTGRVPDVRPYIANASAIVAPLKIARGVQNKVLEAMAMGKPVVATPDACQGIRVDRSSELLAATTAQDFAASVNAVLAGEKPNLGAKARRRILDDYPWKFDVLDGIIAGHGSEVAAAS